MACRTCMSFIIRTWYIRVLLLAIQFGQPHGRKSSGNDSSSTQERSFQNRQETPLFTWRATTPAPKNVPDDEQSAHPTIMAATFEPNSPKRPKAKLEPKSKGSQTKRRKRADHGIHHFVSREKLLSWPTPQMPKNVFGQTLMTTADDKKVDGKV